MGTLGCVLRGVRRWRPGRAAVLVVAVLAAMAAGMVAAPATARAEFSSSGALSAVTLPSDSGMVALSAKKTSSNPYGITKYWNVSTTTWKTTYTGKAIEPLTRIYSSKLRRNLVRGTEYTVKYKNNVSVGTMTVTVAYKGKLSSYGTKTYKIKIERASMGSCSSSLIGSQYYTGKAIKPEPVLKLGGKALKKGADYTLSYKNNVAAGTASVVATGKGSFTGSKTVKFSIVKRAPGLGWTMGAGSLYAGQSATFRAASSLKSAGAVTYASSNGGVATVDARTGTVRAVGAGDAVITATIAANGVFSSQAVSRSVRVRSTDSGFGFYLYGTKRADNCVWGDLRVGSSVVTGSLRSLVKTNSGAQITYYSSTPEVFEVDAAGNYRAKRPGYARLCIAQRSNDYYPAAHVFVNVAVKSLDGRDVTNLEWKACDAVANAAWNTLAAGVALGQGNLPIDTVVSAVLGADAGNALYGLPQLNSALTGIANYYGSRLPGANNATQAISKIAKRYGIKTGAIGVCAVGTIVYAYHLSENTNHTWRFQHNAAYRESAEALMREEVWHHENDWLEVYRIGQLEGWLGTQSLRRS